MARQVGSVFIFNFYWLVKFTMFYLKFWSTFVTSSLQHDLMGHYPYKQCPCVLNLHVSTARSVSKLYIRTEKKNFVTRKQDL